MHGLDEGQASKFITKDGKNIAQSQIRNHLFTKFNTKMKRLADVPAEQLRKDLENEEQQQAPPENREQPESKETGTDQAQKGQQKKVRLAMLVGYNGINFFGSQKNKNIRSVEEEIEKVLFKLDFISHFNFGDLKKIGWGRATRTDKRVHALLNTFSCKFQLESRKIDGRWQTPTSAQELDEIRNQINKELPSDVKIFSLMQVSNNFNAKNATSYREYSYYLPTFMLTPISELYLASPPKKPAGEENKEETKTQVVTEMKPGIKKILRQAGEEDEVENAEQFLERNIEHITDEQKLQMQKVRLTESQREEVQASWKSFQGTKKYHNFTKEIKSHEMAAQRYMMDMQANEFMYVNCETFEVTSADDPKAIEFIRFYLKGQSFLFNQIRKMVGCIIQVFHGQLGPQFIENTHRDNVLQVALAPGDGLLLENVAYDNYNRQTTTKFPVIMQMVHQKAEVEAFRKEIVSYIAQREIKERAFTCWLCYLDDNKEDYYIHRKVEVR